MVNKKKKCFFFDRDGVLNKSIIKDGKPYAPLLFDKFKLYSSAEKVITDLKQKGYIAIVITNQPDINRKKLKISEFKKMNIFLKKKINIDDIFFCPHTPSENCSCRKPKINLFKMAAKKYNISLKNSYMVGDRKIDIIAGKSAGCKTIYIKKKYKEGSPTEQNYSIRNLKEILKIV